MLGMAGVWIECIVILTLDELVSRCALLLVLLCVQVSRHTPVLPRFFHYMLLMWAFADSFC
jgi:hypothetical protein